MIVLFFLVRLSSKQSILELLITSVNLLFFLV